MLHLMADRGPESVKKFLIGKTGIEMESLNAVAIAALTIYDMCKAIDRGMHITDIRLVRKEGGKSGVFTAE